MAVFPEKIDARSSSSLEQRESTKKHPQESEDQKISGVTLDSMAPIDASVETVGKVSEALSNQKDQDLGRGGGATAAKTQYDPAKIKAELLKKAPDREVMVKQIETEIKKEIKYLHNKAIGMISRPGEINYFEMNNMIRKLRELKRILKSLIKASMEGIKTLWLRFVHGIM